MPSATTPAAHGVRTSAWVDLAVGDCLADLPPTDPSIVSVTLVDCGSPHRSEVYHRADVGVDAALADVANRECAAGLATYTGQPLDTNRFTVSYLIDSNQDRTGSNLDASTVICVLQAANGGLLTDSARS